METRWRCPRTGANVDGESLTLMVSLMTVVITARSAHLQADVFWRYEYVWHGWFGKLQTNSPLRPQPVWNHISSLVWIRSWSSIINSNIMKGFGSLLSHSSYNTYKFLSSWKIDSDHFSFPYTSLSCMVILFVTEKISNPITRISVCQTTDMLELHIGCGQWLAKT